MSVCEQGRELSSILIVSVIIRVIVMCVNVVIVDYLLLHKEINVQNMTVILKLCALFSFRILLGVINQNLKKKIPN